MLLSENMYCVAFTFKITEKKEQNSTSKFSLRLYIPLWKLFGWFRRQQHWVTGDWQLQHDNRPTHVSCLCRNFLAKYQITQVNQSTYSPYLALCHIWLFPKLKSPLKGKRFQTVDEIQENMTRQLMAIGRTVSGPKAPTSKATEVSLSYVQCFLHLISSLINASIFHITWLATFWTDLVCNSVTQH